MTETDLDDLLAQAKSQPVEASEALLARVLEDGLALQPSVPVRSARPSAPRIGLLRLMLDVFGGGGALAGLSTAALAGLWLGFAQPAPIARMAEDFISDNEGMHVDLIPGYEELLSEGLTDD